MSLLVRTSRHNPESCCEFAITISVACTMVRGKGHMIQALPASMNVSCYSMLGLGVAWRRSWSTHHAAAREHRGRVLAVSEGRGGLPQFAYKAVKHNIIRNNAKCPNDFLHDMQRVLCPVYRCLKVRTLRYGHIWPYWIVRDPLRGDPNIIV